MKYLYFSSSKNKILYSIEAIKGNYKRSLKTKKKAESDG